MATQYDSNGIFRHSAGTGEKGGQFAEHRRTSDTLTLVAERPQPGRYVEVERHDWLDRSYTIEVNAATGLSDDEVSEMTNHALVAAMWSTPVAGDGYEFLDEEYSISDVSRESRDKLTAELADFIANNRELVDAAFAAPGYQASDGSDAKAMFAHDFILTRNGTGSGFYDRQALRGDLGRQLTEAVSALPEFQLEVGDDGKLYA